MRMDETTAKSHCLRNGSQLLSYSGARAASLILHSGEQVVISIGPTTAKVCVSRPLFGWFLPRVVASERLSKWDDRYSQSNAFYRDVFQAMILDGLLSLVSRFRSVAELQLAWSVLRNPIEVAVLELGYGLSGDSA